ncbi:hypothetical protein [Bradyrhizobium sp. CCBAU 45389]|uniref:hypothetical protein n=1 Tax=Bradyrhizobium sp. CCBAU 45389 TaxID=858429 RepID=UPI002306B5BC|nr:hypothetical protein [Bradyrhizobium sp. CCBAU 45389]MDA9400782.1 hypothetical protein [Bradyrhizobium sp. CCBAU 45389]
MSKTAARFTLADISRAAKAAKAEGAVAVEVLPNGTIRILIAETACDGKPEPEELKHRDFKL